MKRTAVLLLLVLGLGAGGSTARGASGVFDVGPLVLPPAIVDAPYEVWLTGSGGTAPYRFRRQRFRSRRQRRRHWPGGLRLHRDGRLAGTPRRAGVFAFKVKTRDSARPRNRSVRMVCVTVREAGGWATTGLGGPPPAARWGQAAAVDARRDRLVVFGGGSGVNWLSDVVALDLSSGAWSDVTPAGPGPTGRWGHSLVIDAAGDRAIVFGGASVTPSGDVWALDLGGGGWTELHPVGPGPSARRSHVAVFDPDLRRMIVYGGFDTESRDDVWSLDLAGPGAPAWTALAPSGSPPAPREFAAGAFDRARGRMIVFGGLTGGLTDAGVYALDLRAPGGPAWTGLAPGGAGPGPRLSAVVVADPPRDRLVVFGGAAPYGLCGDLWSLDLSGEAAPWWGELALEGTGGPSPRSSASGGVQATTGRVVVAFGNDGALRDDAFAFDAPAPEVPPAPSWSVTDPAGPSARLNHTLVVDPPRRRAILFGGYDGAYRGDTWALDLGDPWSPTFTELVPDGPAPAARFAHAAVLDPDRGRMLVAFGSNRPADEFVYLDDVWALDLMAPGGTASWSEIAPAGDRPPARDEHVAVLDRPNARLVVFGGFDDVTTFGDAWALDLATPGAESWTELHPAGDSPAGRAGAAAVYDPVGRRMLLFGGGDGTAFLGDLWSLDLSVPGTERWERLDLPNAPAGRSLLTMALDPAGPALLLTGGQALTPFADLHRLPLDGSGKPEWTELAPSAGTAWALSSAAADYDPVSGSLVLHGGLAPAARSEVHVIR